MADTERANGYWRGMCTLAEKVHRGQVTQFGGDPKSMEDLADLLRGLGNQDLSDRLMKAAKAHKGAQLFTVELGDGPPVVRMVR